MKWRESISGIYYTRTNQSEFDSKPEFYAAASVDDIALAEAKLHTTFPHCLRSLLLETNGVMEMMKIDTGEWFENIWLVWTIQEIAEQNLAYRAESAKGTIERNFNELVFFSSAGSDGIFFGFPRMEEFVCANRIVVWFPLENELKELAPSLEAFLRGWLSNTISI